ncbi:large conductance mechanosensitive channel protein MscL [Pedobacter sp. MW01-1-1]|uniref:large conductance mechanosensitive channel protein MscL n=1 Tax=Pedobacter sp. MW01-1-1 TaxID=3383027 RepID=UPI003FEEF524
MGFAKEFKEFAVKGNVMDLAVGVIIGGAFGKIIDSVVNDLVMPFVAGIIGKPDFSSWYWDINGKVTTALPLAEAKKVEGAAIFAYGNFLTVAINFVLLAFVVFLLVKGINQLKRKEEVVAAAPPAPTNEEVLLAEIRDLLKK